MYWFIIVNFPNILKPGSFGKGVKVHPNYRIMKTLADPDRIVTFNLGLHCLSKSLYIRDLFHVYLNRFEFNFSRLHIIKTNKFCFFMHNGRVPDIAK